VTEEWESGPFCCHWADPSDCEESCQGCKHQCRQHLCGDFCKLDSCDCKEYVKEPE